MPPVLMRHCAAGGAGEDAAVSVAWFWITIRPQKAHCQQTDMVCRVLEEVAGVWCLVWLLSLIVYGFWASDLWLLEWSEAC